MKTEDFNYFLPEELIAQKPLLDRSASRLMVVDKNNGNFKDDSFKNILQYFKKGDCLVLNDTKVIPARIMGIKEETNASIELLLLKNIVNNIWEALVKPARRVKIGTIVSFGDGLLKAKCVDSFDEGIKHFELIYSGDLNEILFEIGTMPLPPYIHEELKTQNRYQTVYAKNVGSAAAPTAGLHFTPEILEEIKKIGVDVVYVTLHVGLGTFRPVKVDDVTKHVMHSEYYEISEEVANKLNRIKKNGGRVIGVGTTTTRVLESVLRKHDNFVQDSGDTDIFIYPGYKFKAIDILITNFHLPKSTLLMLVSAFSSKEIMLNIYKEAVNLEYRFFSFGDAMMIGDFFDE